MVQRSCKLQAINLLFMEFISPNLLVRKFISLHIISRVSLASWQLFRLQQLLREIFVLLQRR